MDPDDVNISTIKEILTGGVQENEPDADGEKRKPINKK